jgi:hypothetical protein
MPTREAPAPAAPTWDTFALSVLCEAGLAVAVADRSGRLSLLSPALQRLLHQPYRPVTADSFLEEFHLYGQGGKTRPEPEHVPLLRAARTGTNRTGILCLRVPGLPQRRLLWNAHPLATAVGQAHGAFAVVSDVTDRAGGEFGCEIAETVNHLRTSLTLVLQHAELLADRHADLPAQVQCALTALLRATPLLDHSVSLVRGLG